MEISSYKDTACKWPTLYASKGNQNLVKYQEEYFWVTGKTKINHCEMFIFLKFPLNLRLEFVSYNKDHSETFLFITLSVDLQLEIS